MVLPWFRLDVRIESRIMFGSKGQVLFEDLPTREQGCSTIVL